MYEMNVKLVDWVGCLLKQCQEKYNKQNFLQGSRTLICFGIWWGIHHGLTLVKIKTRVIMIHFTHNAL